MIHPRYKDLGIVSAKKPFSAQLFFELDNGYLLLVDSTSRRDLLLSTDKGANWDVFGTGSFGSGKITDDRNIVAAYFDRANGIIYFIGWEVGVDGDKIQCWQLDISTYTASDIGASIDADNANGDGIGLDVWIRDSEIEVLLRDDNGGSLRWELHQWNDPNWVLQDSEILIDIYYFPAVIIGTNAYWVSVNQVIDQAFLVRWNGVAIGVGSGIVNVTKPSDNNMFSISYDGNNILYFPLYHTGDNTNTLYSWNITGGNETKLGAYDVALMLDRNAAGLEKAFHITEYKTYQIKARKTGILLLQDLTNICDAVIIAITDNFVMNDDGDMFEFTDVTNEISTILYTDGIMGILKKGIFTVHPDFHINWNKGDSIKIYDDNGVLEFHGLITDKNRNSRGIYVFKIDSFTNEIYRTTYENDYTGDDTDTKQKDIIDNACDFCYRSSSIVGTTTNYDYAYNRAIIYLFWLARFLERQVPYIEPDGKIWTKAHDGLVAEDMIYAGTFNFKNDADGDEPAGWISNNGADCTTKIIAVEDGHRKVLQCFDNSNPNKCEIKQTFTGQISGTVEVWWKTSDKTKRSNFFLRKGGVAVCRTYAFETGFWRYYDGGVPNDVLAIVNNRWYHHKYVFDCATDTWDWYIDGVQYGAGIAFDAVQDTLDNVIINSTGGPSNYSNYFDAIGFSWDPAYTVGDNEVAWDINNNWQEVFLVDIPNIEEIIQGFFDGNSGITRNTIRYKNNATTIRPVAATRDPIEQLQGILPLNEFRDPKIEAATEANQLGDNRYNIWSSDIIFLGLRIEGQGYLQPGKTIEIQNTGEITITKNDYLVLSFERDPKNDVYIQMILSDNIIFPLEFNNLQNTSAIQIHTASVQSLENQANIAVFIPRRLSQSAEPTPAVGELIIWRDTDDNKTYIVYNDTIEGVRKVELI